MKTIVLDGLYMNTRETTHTYLALRLGLPSYYGRNHDALHDVDAAIAEAQICLECEDHDDFLRTMSTVRAGLEHLKDEEALRLANLY